MKEKIGIFGSAVYDSPEELVHQVLNEIKRRKKL